ncbi:MAG: hypothetical protein K0U41_05480 [Gammaproteobacteria bacterium]|nr:hypothetical protein [Gammaproteobacteria bacterium]
MSYIDLDITTKNTSGRSAWSPLRLGLLLIFTLCISGELLAETYSWSDAKRTHKIKELTHLEAEFTRGKLGITGNAKLIKKRSVATQSDAQNEPSDSPSQSEFSPVFMDSSGSMRALPGGVLVAFRKSLTPQEILNFWHSRGIDISEVSQLGSMNSLYKVQTAVGMESLLLSNELAKYPQVEVVSPNWWVQRQLR